VNAPTAGRQRRAGGGSLLDRTRPSGARSAASSAGLAAAVWASCGALVVFVVAMAAAAAAYPGGSWTEPEATGFSIARNFWCDLLRTRAINGEDNLLGKRLASLAFAALGLGLWPYWWVAGAVFEGRRRKLVVGLGAASAAALAAMTLLPSDRFPIGHGLVALCGALFGMSAAGVSVAGRSPNEPRLGVRRTLGAFTLACAACNALLYVHVVYLGGAETPTQPIVQKLATLGLVCWMLATVRRARASDDQRRMGGARTTPG
jgi:hypothetical protein